MRHRRGIGIKTLFRSTLLGLVVCALTLSLFAIKPQKASADACSINGRNCYYGYFFNGYDGGPGALQHNVLTAPALLNVFNAAGFITEMNARLSGCYPGGVLPNPNDQNQTGAAFIILTMLGYPPGTPKNVACQQFTQWADLVRYYEAAGLVNFNQVFNFGGINTRSSGPDVAYYPDSGAAPSIVFYHPVTRQPLYAIKKDCGNPIGRLQRVFLDFNLTSTVRPYVNGVISTQAEPGDSVNFQYAINNNGPTASGTTNCYGGKLNRPGYHNPVSPAEGGGIPLNLSCPRSTFAVGQNQLVGVEAPFTATENMSYCRTLFVTPSSESGGTYSTEVCINVVSKPYFKVNGGDVSVGGDLETAPDVCPSNSAAAVTSWNKRNAGLYSGAGTQLGAFALSRLNDFASAQGSPAGGAAPGTGLSFANVTTNPATGNFGGNFGTAPVKCIKDYYSQKPASTTTLTDSNVSNLISGAYAATGNVTLSGGNVNPHQRIRLFVDGDLFITNNVTFAGSWDYNSIPLFQVVVRGNIYLSNNVQQLDGVYIAQPVSGTKGYVYTCAAGFAAPSVTSNFYTNCSNKLVLNGSLVSRSTEFLRNEGTLKQSDSGDFSAELFNYGPAFWITQPDSAISDDGKVDNYDSITSLPPVL